MGVSGQLHAPAALPPSERAAGTHWIGGWVGPRAVLDAVAKRKIPSSRQELIIIGMYFHMMVQVRLEIWTDCELRLETSLWK
jgi:hypothetical protein